MRMVIVSSAVLAAAVAGATAPPALAAPIAPAVGRSAAPAATSVVVGSTGPAGQSCTNNAAVTQVGLGPASPTYTVPGAGVVTSVSHQASATAGSIRVLTTGPGSSPSTRAIRSYTAAMPVTPSTLNTMPVRIPVAAGSTLGLFTSTLNMSCYYSSGDPADIVGGQGSFNAETSSELSVTSTVASIRVNLSAVWEPDADGDGYGDVSQDLCPQSKLAQVACPAPDTTVTKQPKKRSTKRKGKIVFSSSVPGSTFTCTVDGKAPVPCTSPFKKRYKYGKHAVVITATSPAGIVDPTPTTVKFKVKRPD